MPRGGIQSFKRTTGQRGKYKIQVQGKNKKSLPVALFVRLFSAAAKQFNKASSIGQDRIGLASFRPCLRIQTAQIRVTSDMGRASCALSQPRRTQTPNP